MYHTTKSIRIKYLLPWSSVPDVSDYGPIAKGSVSLARFCAWIAALVILNLVFMGIVYDGA
jgi:hypothetical protein